MQIKLEIIKKQKDEVTIKATEKNDILEFDFKKIGKNSYELKPDYDKSKNIQENNIYKKYLKEDRAVATREHNELEEQCIKILENNSPKNAKFYIS